MGVGAVSPPATISRKQKICGAWRENANVALYACIEAVIRNRNGFIRMENKCKKMGGDQPSPAPRNAALH